MTYFTAATHLVIVLCTNDSSTDGYGGTDSKTEVGQPRHSPLRCYVVGLSMCISASPCQTCRRKSRGTPSCGLAGDDNHIFVRSTGKDLPQDSTCAHPCAQYVLTIPETSASSSHVLGSFKGGWQCQAHLIWIKKLHGCVCS